MKLYTRAGDQGYTSLFNGQRVRKDDPRVEAYGTVDELNSLLGWCAAGCGEPELAERLGVVQEHLFRIGADLATPPEAEPSRSKVPIVDGARHPATGKVDRRSLPGRRSAANVHSAGGDGDRDAPAHRADDVPAGGATRHRTGPDAADLGAGAGLPEPAGRPAVRVGAVGQPPRRPARRAVGAAETRHCFERPAHA